MLRHYLCPAVVVAASCGAGSVTTAMLCAQSDIVRAMALEEQLSSYGAIYITTDDLTADEFEHFFRSWAFAAVMRSLCLRHGNEPGPSIMIPAEVLRSIAGLVIGKEPIGLRPGRVVDEVVFGGREESPYAWVLRDMRIGVNWDFKRRSAFTAHVSTKAASPMALRALARVVLRATQNRKQGLRLSVERQSGGDEDTCRVRLLWNTRDERTEVRIGGVLTSGCVPAGKATLKVGMSLKNPFDQSFDFKCERGTDAVVVVTAGNETAADVAHYKGRQEALLKQGLEGIAHTVTAAIGTWHRGVLKVRITEVNRIAQGFGARTEPAERARGVVLDDRWWGWAVRSLWTGEPIALLNKPSESCPGLPLGRMKVGEDYWIVVGPSTRGWYGILHADSGKEVVRK
ncbi:MAG: hypothetical protein IT458_01815 [Planctomycetes bacterium]|nr:hypothetical protein [Planctomycetota bacterium]